MSAISRPTGPGVGALYALGIGVATVAAAAMLPTMAAWINTGQLTGINPFEAIVTGTPWTPAHTLLAVIAGVLVVALAVGAIVAVVREGRRSTPADKAAPYLGKGREIAALRPPALAKKHRTLGLDPRRYPGVMLGQMIRGTEPLRASYEDTVTIIAGPRRRKTTVYVIPNILAAPGACLVTSVRPDVMITAAQRATVGTVYLFDPQNLAEGFSDERAWWNPLGSVRTITDAEKLADVFGAAAYGADSQDDPFFAKQGRDLIARYMFAAARAGKYLPSVYEWLTRWDDTEPERILEDEYPHIADGIRATQTLTEKTRSGVYGWALGAMGFLTSDELRSWVVPNGSRELIPELFTAGTANTLYLLSREEAGGAAPLVGALTRAVLTAAEVDAARTGGRRAVPMLAILDEAANICPIPDLPKKFSFYGGAGIVLIAILQSEAQAVERWGRNGFDAMWAASTVQVFAGGNASNDFLRAFSEIIGDYFYIESVTSYHRGERHVNRNRQRDRIMDPADLSALSLGRAIVKAQGCRATLVRAVPWFEDKELIKLMNVSEATQRELVADYTEDERVAA